MITTHRISRVSVATVSAVLLVGGLTACGGGEVSVEEFCKQGEAMSDGMNDVDMSDPDAAAAALKQTVAEAKKIKAPSEISDDWSTVVDGVSQMADNLDGVDLTDTTAVMEALESIQSEDFAAASERVSTYTSENCTSSS